MPHPHHPGRGDCRGASSKCCSPEAPSWVHRSPACPATGSPTQLCSSGRLIGRHLGSPVRLQAGRRGRPALLEGGYPQPKALWSCQGNHPVQFGLSGARVLQTPPPPASTVPEQPLRADVRWQVGGQRTKKSWVLQGGSRAPHDLPTGPWLLPQHREGFRGTKEARLQDPRRQPAPWDDGRPREVAGGFHHPQEGPSHEPGSTRRKHRKSLGVSLLVIQLVLCQEEVVAWRNASTF